MEHQHYLNKYQIAYRINKPKIAYHGFAAKKIIKTINYANKSQELRNPFLIKITKTFAHLKLSINLVITVLHNIFSKRNNFTFKKILEHLSFKIVNSVCFIKNLTKLDFFQNNKIRIKNFCKTLLSVRADIKNRMLPVKSLFLLDNLVTSYSTQAIKIDRFIALKIIAVYTSITNKIGPKPITEELQDFCFNILYPTERSCIYNYLQSKFNIKVNLVNKIIDSLRNVLSKSGIKITILGRVKSPYSIWIKMERKKVKLEELPDILGFRIIVNTKDECYNVLKVIHHVYKIVPGNFRDYIKSPKNNGYQSIHTVIIGPSEQKIEIQIRTKEMQHEAKNGACAHWKYKTENPNPVLEGLTPIAISIVINQSNFYA